MKRDIYAYLTSFMLILAVGFSVFLVVSDNSIPFTTQATVKTSVTRLSPEVSGHIEHIFVTEGQTVAAGDTLIQLDRSHYDLAVEKAQANAQQALSQAQQAVRYFDRVSSLYQTHSTSKERLDEALAAKQAAQALQRSAQADLHSAQRALDHTKIRAQHSGIVTNLTYQAGMYVTPTDTVIHLVNPDQFWIAADFTEKGLPVLTQDKAVNIVFDAYPNNVFRGRITSVDPAILSGTDTTQQIAAVENESRWIRPQQKIRVRIVADQGPQRLIAGSRASVMVRDESRVSDSWMTLLSWMRYVY